MKDIAPYMRQISTDGYLLILSKLKGKIENIKIILNLTENQDIKMIPARFLNSPSMVYEVYHTEKLGENEYRHHIIGVCGIINATNTCKINPIVFATFLPNYESFEEKYILSMTDKAFKEYRHTQVEMVLFESEGKLEEKIKSIGFVPCGKREKCVFDNGKYLDVQYFKKYI